MIIKIKKNSDVPSSEVTSESEYLNRRSFLAASATAIGATAGAAALLGRAASPLSAAGSTPASASAVQELEPTAEKLITSYNNFYEFGLAKEDPAKHAHALVTEPWSVVVDGLCNNPAEVPAGRVRLALHDRGSRVPLPLRGGVVDGRPLARLPLGRRNQARGPHRRRRVRGVRDAVGPGSDAAGAVAELGTEDRLALPGRPAPGRGDASAGVPGHRAVRQGTCPTRTGRRSGWWCRGSTASRASSRSCA